MHGEFETKSLRVRGPVRADLDVSVVHILLVPGLVRRDRGIALYVHILCMCINVDQMVQAAPLPGRRALCTVYRGTLDADGARARRDSGLLFSVAAAWAHAALYR